MRHYYPQEKKKNRYSKNNVFNFSNSKTQRTDYLLAFLKHKISDSGEIPTVEIEMKKTDQSAAFFFGTEANSVTVLQGPLIFCSVQPRFPRGHILCRSKNAHWGE
ncbi:hypothetical protein TNCT_302891 [Trichonephila clavata]|uniref:Uncharacterized protein n=1 Tax=Trichonephila clavata TaxID=2740835 RepID=A0A8X6GDI0_TRICU|nr:hypothetical protein TNCT_302891 [Trichonephila clavata]